VFYALAETRRRREETIEIDGEYWRKHQGSTKEVPGKCQEISRECAFLLVSLGFHQGIMYFHVVSGEESSYVRAGPTRIPCGMMRVFVYSRSRDVDATIQKVTKKICFHPRGGVVSSAGTILCASHACSRTECGCSFANVYVRFLSRNRVFYQEIAYFHVVSAVDSHACAHRRGGHSSGDDFFARPMVGHRPARAESTSETSRFLILIFFPKLLIP